MTQQRVCVRVRRVTVAHSERASHAARGSIHVSGSGQMELGARLSDAAKRWRRAAQSAHSEALAAAARTDLLSLLVTQLLDAAAQLDAYVSS